MPSDQAPNGGGDYVALCRQCVADQRRRILRLGRLGQSTARARDLLETFEFALDVAIRVAESQTAIGKVERPLHGATRGPQPTERPHLDRILPMALVVSRKWPIRSTN